MTVSVILPAYNAAATIGRALASVFAQTRLPDELIVVDDGSTDGTAAAVTATTGPVPVRFITQENAGPAAARNAGAAAATGEWLAFLDADDAWLPGKLAVQAALAEADPALGLVIGNYEIAGTGKRLVPDFVPSPAAATPGQLLRTNFFAPPVVFVRRTAFLGAGGFDVRLRAAEDQELGFRLVKRERFVLDPAVVATVHPQPRSASNREHETIAGLLALYALLLQRDDLTADERETVLRLQRFWQARERLFAVRWYAAAEGQLAGLGAFGRYLWPRHLSIRAFGLLVLLLVPGAIPLLRATRWRSLDFGPTSPEPAV